MENTTTITEDNHVEAVGHCRPPVSTRFQPGKSGNPNGRPPGIRNMREVVNEILDRDICIPGIIDPDTGGEKSNRVGIVVAQVKQALQGSTAAFKELCDRADGKAVQAIELGNVGAREEFEKRLREGETPEQIMQQETVALGVGMLMEHSEEDSDA